MGKCSDCGERYGENGMALEFEGERCTFCSWECLISYAAASLRRRIARRNKRVQRYARAKMRCQTLGARGAAKAGVRL